MTDEQTIERLRKALDAATDIGIYPKAVIGGENPYEKRTEWMEGWNAAMMEVHKRVVEAFPEIDEEAKPEPFFGEHIREAIETFKSLRQSK